MVCTSLTYCPHFMKSQRPTLFFKSNYTPVRRVKRPQTVGVTSAAKVSSKIDCKLAKGTSEDEKVFYLFEKSSNSLIANCKGLLLASL